MKLTSWSVRCGAWIVAPLLCVSSGCEPTMAADEAPSAIAAQVSAPAPSRPTVSGPVSGGRLGGPLTAMPKAFADEYGYLEEEFFVEGTAAAYETVGTVGQDGEWTLAEKTTAPFRTRILVRRPRDPARFNGTVVVEWFNVTGGLDADVDFRWMHKEILRSGDIYVGVSAQQAGVEVIDPLAALLGLGGRPLKAVDAQRYGSLRHPGDHFSYDIFSQVGRALTTPSGVDPLHGQRPKQLIAVGESQSAARLLSYVNGVHPRDPIYDGFLIHSRNASGTGFAPGSPIVGSDTYFVRTDLAEPVLQLETETDIVTLGFLPARQPDTDKLRTWEVAGSAHIEQYALRVGRETAQGSPATSTRLSCPNANDGQQTFVLRRALSDLRTWAAGGAPPASGPQLLIEGTLKRDAHGIAMGGIRMPAVDVPIATLSGLPAPSAGIAGLCGVLFGSTVPFSAEKLHALYPTHEDYVGKVRISAESAIAIGFMLEADKAELVGEAERANVPPT